jgi:hypothetical protein
MKSVSDKPAAKNKLRISLSILFFEIHDVFEMITRNIVRPGMPHMKI